MAHLPRAETSPDIENGVIKWYEGDTFLIALELELRDQFDEPVTLTEEDTVTIEYRNAREEVVHSQQYSGVVDNCIELVVDEDTTRHFPAGKYCYDIRLESETRTTLASGNKIVVKGGWT